jgi:ferredoxin, 2Fe-2S
MSDIAFTYIRPDGSEKPVEAMEGITLMEAALICGVDGIQGLCGGICSCATCHVTLEKEVYDRLAPPDEGEAEMIAMLDDHGATSRLGCQVPIGDALRGARITIMGTGA